MSTRPIPGDPTIHIFSCNIVNKKAVAFGLQVGFQVAESGVDSFIDHQTIEHLRVDNFFRADHGIAQVKSVAAQEAFLGQRVLGKGNQARFVVPAEALPLGVVALTIHGEPRLRGERLLG